MADKNRPHPFITFVSFFNLDFCSRMIRLVRDA